MVDPAHLDALTTPVAWTGAEGKVAGANLAFGRWLGVAARRVHGLPLAALEADGRRLADWLAQAGTGTAGMEEARLRRLAFAFPGNPSRFADAALSPRGGGGRGAGAPQVHEFPGRNGVGWGKSVSGR